MSDGEMLNSALFEVQRQALKKGHKLPGFAFYLEQGLGKTMTLLYDIYWHMEARRVDVAFVLCPRSLRGTWRSEAEKIGFPYPVLLMDGTAEQMWKRIMDAKGPVVVVIHYELVLTRGGDLIELVKAKGKKMMLGLDEATRIKNPQAKVGKYLIKIKDWFAYIRILTGSPAPQGVHDLWAQFTLIGLITSPYYGFRNTYCKLGGWMGKKIVGAQNLDILHERTDHGVFRGKKSEWTDIPEKIYPHPREVEMTKKQRQAYLTMMHDMIVEWGDHEITAKMAVTAKGKLAQISSGFLYNEEKEIVRLFEPGEKNPKFTEMVDVIEETPNKILLFYYFKPTLQFIKEALDAAGIKYVELVSGLKDDEIEERKRQFNEDDEVKIAICQTGAIKYGHTLLGTASQPCMTTVFVENSYDMEARIQAEDRNHRHGQLNHVTYIDIATSREDLKVIKALQVKSGLQEAILSEFKSEKVEWN